jgi:uncharacterized protein
MFKTYRLVTLAKTFVLFLTIFAASAVSAFALDLETARTKGLIGEVDDGYIAIPPGKSAEAQKLVETVNLERRAVYADIAQKNGISVEVTGQRTFEKRYPGFPAGTWVKIKGAWSQK